MSFEWIDRYLLGEAVSKTVVVEQVLAQRSERPQAAPFYRALEAVGARAADEAFIALRLVLAGEEPSDDRVRRLRALSAVARAGAARDRPAMRSALQRNARVLDDLHLDPNLAPERLGTIACAAYRREVRLPGPNS